jgi:transposase-like protein
MAVLPTLQSVMARYSDEKTCLERVAKIWWPEGLSCGNCGSRNPVALTVRGRPGRTRHLYQCSGCRAQYSVTVGTILHGSHVPLTTWFLAFYFMEVSRQQMPAAHLQRILGVSYETAWSMRQRVRAAPARQQAFFAQLFGPE